MAEWRLFGDEIPDYATPEWYRDRDAAPHLEQEGHRERLILTGKLVMEAVQISADADRLTSPAVVDLGAGDGGLLSLIQRCGIQCWGYDLQPSNVAAATMDRGVDVRYGDFLNDPTWPAEIVVMSEVLEHLVDPHAMVRRIHDDLMVQFLIATSPYTETPESHYGFHLYAWDLIGYRKLFEDAGWVVLRQETAWISQCLLLGRQ